MDECPQIGLYIHVPFCRTRCPYCDFVSNAVPDDVPESFLAALCREIERFDGPSDADSVFLGGGTPSLLTPATLERLLGSLHNRFRIADAEITIEANPDDVTSDLVDAWVQVGINRVSLGVQSFDDGVLAYLGRRHDSFAARDACACVAERVSNWSMDLMFGAGSAESWRSALDETRGFQPSHVSVYGLTYEPDTAFADRAMDAIDDETYLALYWEAHERLDAYGHYEVSNYAQPGLQCGHNLRYWKNLEYAGFGPAAYSFLDGVRSRNLVELERYLDSPGEKGESLRLSDGEIRTETVIQHLRLEAGLNKREYLGRFDRDVHDDFGAQLKALVERGLVEETPDSFRPTHTGFELNNEIGLALVK